MDLKFLRVLLLALLEWRATGHHVQLVEGPATLLLPVNKNGTFSCKAQCDHHCAAFWVINGSEFKDVIEHRQQMHRQLYGNTSVGYTLTLTVNASNTLNNTRIKCRYEATGSKDGHVYSREALLLVISKPPISPNPFFERNATHLSLLWSPPFLWSGHRIDYYNISITTTCCYGKCSNNADTEYHIRNSSYNAVLLSFVHALDKGESQQSSMFSCNNITFSITAVEELSAEPLPKLCKSEWVLTLPSSSIFTPSVFHVAFKADQTPSVVKVYIQLYRLECSCHEMNLTLVVRDERGDLVTEADVNCTPSIDSGYQVIEELLVINFKGNKVYSLQLKIIAYTRILVTDKHYIKNGVELPGAQLYKVGFSISVSIAALLLSTLIALLGCLCTIYRRKINETMLGESKIRACNAMVHNPIYDPGARHIYESIHDQQSLDQLAAKTATHYSSNQDDSLTNTVRYIDQPVCFHSNTSDDTDSIVFNNTNFTNTQKPTAPFSVPTTGSMALKKCGQERNKLHLTLSLTGYDSTPTKGETVLTLCTDHLEIANETHTEMSQDEMLCPTTTSRSDTDFVQDDGKHIKIITEAQEQKHQV